MPNLRQIRALAFQRQNGRCYYCQQPMWCEGAVASDVAHPPRRFQCTAEHLLARQDGGGNEPGNIVAACAFCNRKRHQRKRPKSPEVFKEFVRSRIRRGRWHPTLPTAKAGRLSY